MGMKLEHNHNDLVTNSTVIRRNKILFAYDIGPLFQSYAMDAFGPPICFPMFEYDYNSETLIRTVDVNRILKNVNVAQTDLTNNLHDNGLDDMYTDPLKYNDSKNTIDGIPAEFINSFGNYLAIKYFLNGSSQGKNVYTYVDKTISPEDFETIKKSFKSCRHIFRSNMTEYEFYNEECGYIVISQTASLTDRLTITCAIGYEELYKLIQPMGNTVQKTPMATWVTGVDNYGDLVTKTFSLQSIHEYKHEFYPFMEGESIESFAKRYMESKSSILLLIGPPGTAKTNFIRQLLSSTNESVLLTYSDDLKKADSLFSHFYDSPERFLIIEDADTYIERREDGNSNMKQLLNITDGLTANPHKKVIFSTNLPNLSRVEPALLRPGRCFDKLQFGRLTGDDLVNAMGIIGHDKYDNIAIPSNGFTIAELFAIACDEPLDAENDTQLTSFGFKK